MKTLYAFDFDDTLIYTELPETGKSLWKKATGTDWSYVGWWSKVESLDIDIFENKTNDWVYKEYLKSLKDPNSERIVCTGRLNRHAMRKAVYKILDKYGFEFDEIYLREHSKMPHNGERGIYMNDGGHTFEFKIELYEELIKMFNYEKFVMYDDRVDHMPKFRDWAKIKSKELNCEMVIVDVPLERKDTFTIN